MEDLRRSEIARLEQEAKKQKIREKEALIDELMFTDGNAKDILNSFAQTIANNKQEEIIPNIPKVCTCNYVVINKRVHKHTVLFTDTGLYHTERAAERSTCKIF